MFSPFLCEISPSITESDLCCTPDKQCSEESKSDESPQKQKPSENDGCTPCCIFQICYCYVGEAPQFHFTIRKFENQKKFIALTEITSTGFLSACWNPPKVV